MPHPDYLLGADRLANFHRRGLTARQWADWRGYLKLFPLPHDRADINTALSRATALGVAGAKRVKAAKLVPAYGRVARRRPERELRQIAIGMVSASAKANP